MRRLLFISAFVTISFITYSQSNPDEIIKKFFDEYAVNTNQALDNLYATNPWTTRIKDAIENLKKEVSSYTNDYVGKYYGYELITKKQFSQSFVLYSYMIKYDREPMRFVFEFYKPKDIWHLNSFNIDTKIDDELEEAAKLYYLNLIK